MPAKDLLALNFALAELDKWIDVRKQIIASIETERGLNRADGMSAWLKSFKSILWLSWQAIAPPLNHAQRRAANAATTPLRCFDCAGGIVPHVYPPTLAQFPIWVNLVYG